MSELAILVPVLDRPHRVHPLLESIRETTPDAHVLFICDAGDEQEIRAIEEAIVDFGAAFVDYIVHDGGYAQKINQGIEVAEHLVRPSYYFFGADDLKFQRGWFEEAAGIDAQVVGVNDLLKRGREHATHFLVAAGYARQPTIDGKQGPLHEAYSHWYTDDEFVATAKHRGVYAYAKRAHVKHLHYLNGLAEDDDTYRKGRAMARQDRRLYRRRLALWN